jgi:1,4-dihydroxy-2-naphthoate octaprenyltransferase
MNRFRAYLTELRLPFLTVSVLPVILATAIARYETGTWHPMLFWLTLAGAALMHLGSNTINDWFDHRSGNDEANVDFAAPFTGGSRMIQAGTVSPGGVLILSIVLFALAAAIGAYLYTLRGPAIILLGITGLMLGILYTEPRAMLAGRGLGELSIFLAFGLTAVGAYYVQTGHVSALSLLAPLPLAILTTAIIIINEFQDASADEETGKNTLIVRMGKKRGSALYSVVMLLSFVPVIAGAASGLMPKWTLLALLALITAGRAISIVRAAYDDPKGMTPANGLTIVSHLVMGIILILVFFFLG